VDISNDYLTVKTVKHTHVFTQQSSLCKNSSTNVYFYLQIQLIKKLNCPIIDNINGNTRIILKLMLLTIGQIIKQITINVISLSSV